MGLLREKKERSARRFVTIRIEMEMENENENENRNII